MTYKENINKATDLKKVLDTFRPLSSEVEMRIMQKFRLDWSYHSLHIEGNQLTYGETKALILFGHTAQAKPLKDHIEMTGHNNAIKYIEEVIQQQRPLTENFIRELHELILKEPYEVDAITPDGQPTKRMISIGKYKTVPNHVKTKTGEIFYFANPEETPAKMFDLMNWYNENLTNDAIHPIIFATEFHYKFICIHPFDDGNGRIARLLMNFILLIKGYPPAIIKTEDKNNYFNALQQADAGQLDFFFNYLCEQVVHSLELMIKGAKGEDIEEPEDLDKKLALLEKELEAIDSSDEVKLRLNEAVLVDNIKSWVVPLITAVIPEIQKFNKFFNGTQHSFQLADKLFSKSFVNENPNKIVQDYLIELNKIPWNFQNNFIVHRINTHYGNFIKGGLDTFGCNYSIEIHFSLIKYEVYIDEFQEGNNYPKQVLLFEKLLHKPLTETEIKTLVKRLTNAIYTHIDFYSKKIGIR